MDHAAPTSMALRAVQQRSAALRALFDEISVVRMHGVPILNPALRVATVGFEVMGLPAASSAAATAAPATTPSAMASTSAATTQAITPASDAPLSAVGILITPWFMNLVCFSLARQDQPALVGSSRAQVVGTQSFDFIAAHEERFGSYAACSLFSPMFEFKDQATAVATAEAVLAELRKPPDVLAANSSTSAQSASASASKQVATTPSAAPQAAAPAPPGLASVSGRRGFLFGRRSTPPGAAP